MIRQKRFFVFSLAKIKSEITEEEGVMTSTAAHNLETFCPSFLLSLSLLSKRRPALLL